MDLLLVCNYWTYCTYIVESQKGPYCCKVKSGKVKRSKTVVRSNSRFCSFHLSLGWGLKSRVIREGMEASGSRLDKFFLIIRSLSFGQGRNTHTPVLSSEIEFWISQAILPEKALDCLMTQTAKALPIPTYNRQQGAKTGLNSFWCQAVPWLQLEGISGDSNW